MIRQKILLLCMLAGCGTEPDVHVAAADVFTRHYAQSRLAKWNVRASAAGPDCNVLFVRTSIIMDDSMIEAMHYGAGPYGVYDGGVQHFYRDRAFRGVIYRDPTEKVWAYGQIKDGEAATLAPCR